MENKKSIAIIGGGIAGIETALCLAENGYKVDLLEKSQNLGGNVANWHRLFPDFYDPEKRMEEKMLELVSKNVRTIVGTEITGIEKQKKRFQLKSSNNLSLLTDAVVFATGFNVFEARRKEEYGYGLFKNVITSADLEAILKSKSKTETLVAQKPGRIAIVHCVGSRDAKTGNTYCSKVCCITGIKQAIELSELLPHCEIFCFYMDLRLYGSKFDDLYLTAQKKHKIQFIRGRVSEASEKIDGKLQIKAEDTLSGRPLRMEVDMMVLLAGMEPCISETLTANQLLSTNEHGFFKAQNMHFDRNRAETPGIFYAGACTCPMSVSDAVENARSAALEVMNYLKNN